MKLIDFDSGNELDQVLLNCCQLIFKKHHQDDDYWGKVAACVIDDDGNKVYGVNHLTREGTRIHAERAAINNYIKKFGKDPKDSTIVTTLSPCNRDMKERWGESCTDLLNDKEIKEVYCGYEDPWETDSSGYKNKKFNLKISRNKKINELCQKFANTFLKQKEE